MSEDYTGFVEHFKELIMHFIGEETAKIIMKGSEKAGKLSQREFSLWLKTVIDRLDENVDEKTKLKIMEESGRGCYEMHKMDEPYLSDFAKIKQFDTLDEYVKNNEYYPEFLTKSGNVIYQSYNPHKTHGMRCYCSMWFGLQADETVSGTWCHCSKGLVIEHWKNLLEKFNM